MSDFETLNNPELEQLEQSLQSISLKPSIDQQEQYLFHCGQAAGRTEVKKRMLISSSLAGLFAMSTLCLSLMLWNQPVPNPHQDPIIIAPYSAPQQIPNTNFQPGMLRVGNNLDDLLVTQKIELNKENVPLPSTGSHPTMTTRSWPELLDN